MRGATDLPLSGFLVVDLSAGIAGAYCTKLLADGGAEVIKVETPTGDPLRAWSASGAEIAPSEDGALFSFLAGAKRSVVVDAEADGDRGAVHTLLEDADAVVLSRDSAAAAHPSLAAAELRSRYADLTVTSISPFGLEGRWADHPATEFTLQAWAGAIVGSGRGMPDRAPVHVGGQVGEWLAGAFAAVGTMVSHRRPRAAERGEIVDVSVLETLILCLTFYPTTFHDQLGKLMYEERFVRTPGVAAAKDGLVGLGCGTGQQWLDFCVMVGHPEWMDDPSLFTERRALAPIIDAWVAEHTVDEVRALATSFRIPNAPIGDGANLPDLEHFAVRGSFVANPRDGFLQPDHPYRLQPAKLRAPERAPRLGEHTGAPWASEARLRAAAVGEPGALPFADLRVLDMTAFWAGPSCTQVMAMLGAEVIHLESPSRPDGARLVGGIPHSEDQWWERSPIFAALNTDKKSLTLDLATERGRDALRRLIPTCDVIVENYTPRVMDQIGFDYESVRALRPDVIMVRMPGFGLDGPWRELPAMAFIIEDATGFTALTGYPDVNPFEPWTVADPAAGLHGLSGLLLALEHRRKTGEGGLVEAAMADAAINLTAEQVIEHSAYGALLRRAGNRGPAAAPQNVYATGGGDPEDSWVAIAVATDEQWNGLREALGEPEWAASPDLATAAGRRARHDLIDEHLAAWCGELPAADIVAALWDAGVPVGEVLSPDRQADLPQLQDRGFFEALDHPSAGTARYSTMPMSFSDGPNPRHTRHAPLFGEHNRELLSGIGFSDAEIDELETAHVIGRAVVG